MDITVETTTSDKVKKVLSLAIVGFVVVGILASMGGMGYGIYCKLSTT